MFKLRNPFKRRPDPGQVVAAAGQLPEPPPPKVKPKQLSYPGYIKSTTPSSAVLQRTDPGLANLDIASSYRLGANTPEILRNLVRANPDLSAAVSAHLRVGIPERYIALARDPDGTVNDKATLLIWEMMQRMDKMPAYDSGFSQVDSLRSISESLGKEALTYGGMALELVLDKARMPYKLQPIHVPSIKFYEDNSGGTKGLKPVQDVGGVQVDLDVPTVFMVWLDPSLLDPYPQSPLDSAIQPVLASSTFLADLRKVMARHVHPRYDVVIDEEKLRANIPEEVLHDPEPNVLNAYLNSIITEIENTINGLGVEEALVHYDFISMSYVKHDDGQGTAEKFKVLEQILNANLAKGAKTMPAVLGNGSGSQNVASTETMLFALTANSMIRVKLQELYSKAFTLACRVVGMPVTVSFEFDEIELRPATELEAFKQIRAERLRQQWSLGMIGDMEACLRLTGFPPPKGFKPLSGTGFANAGAGSDTSNPYSGTGVGGGQSGGGAANQSRKPGTPENSKGPAK